MDLILILLVTAFGAMFFLCITRSIEGISLINPWISAMICAVVFEMLLILFAITVGIKRIIVPIVVIAFLPSIIFLLVIGHTLAVLIATLIVIKGLYVMRYMLFNALKIDIGTVVRGGVAYLSFALVIVVTSQYYFFIKQNTETLFDASNYVQTSNLLIDQILKSGNVDDISINAMTVDDFAVFMIEKVYKQEQAQGPRVSDDEGMIVRWASQAGVDIKKIEEVAENQVVEQMVVNISEMTGREVAGDELVHNVFAEIISTQINNIIEKNDFLSKNKANILTFGFFLIIFLLAPIVKIITGWCTRFAFMLLREFKIVRVKKMKRDVEVIVF